MRKSPETVLAMARKPQKLPDYFTPNEASALVAAATSYQVRMAMRIMLRTGLRVSECLSLRPADLRLNQDPPILSLRPDVPGNKAKRGREVPVPADLVESLADLKSFHRRERNRPLFDISRQWASKSMKEAAVAAGLDSARAHPAPSGTLTGGARYSAACQPRCSSLGLATCPWRRPSVTSSWRAVTTPGWKGRKNRVQRPSLYPHQ